MNSRAVMLAVTLLTVTIPARADDLPGNKALFARLDSNKNGLLTADEVAAEHQRLFSRLLRTGDEDGNAALTSEEFTAALAPSRPEKPMEAEQEGEFPGAKAIRWLLLTLDTNGDSRLTEAEVPEDYRADFDRLVDAIDRDEDGILNRGEINRGGPQIARVAQRTVRRTRINLNREHDRLVKQQGDRASRFDQPPDLRQALTDPSNAREFFARLDANSDGYLEIDELPEPARERLNRPFRRADADRDGNLSQQEFATLARRIGGLVGTRERRVKPKP